MKKIDYSLLIGGALLLPLFAFSSPASSTNCQCYSDGAQMKQFINYINKNMNPPLVAIETNNMASVCAKRNASVGQGTWRTVDNYAKGEFGLISVNCTTKV